MDIIARAYGLLRIVERFIYRVKQFYYQVVLIGHACPICAGKLAMVREGLCRCQACGHEFETMQKISEDALKDCPECQQSRLKKLISAAGFQLKGNGWYATDFKDQKGAKPKADNTTKPTIAASKPAKKAGNDK